jgi:hypothetical protein
VLRNSAAIALTQGGHVTLSKLSPIVEHGYAKARELAIAERQRQLERASK